MASLKIVDSGVERNPSATVHKEKYLCVEALNTAVSY